MAIQTFDQTYYLTNNPDVQNAVLQGTFTSALQHYLLFGENEGRMPNQFFDTAGYFADNADVLAAKQNGTISSALDQYERFGAAEGRTPGDITFDDAYYLAQNPDVAAAVPGTFNSGYSHYVLFGAAEGRLPAEGGDVQPGATFDLTPGVDFADTAGSTRNNGTISSDFVFTTDSETVNAVDHTFMTGDTLIDASTADNDMLVVAATGAAAINTATTANIETLEFNFTNYTGGALNMPAVGGAQTLDLNGSLDAVLTVNNLATTGITTVDGTGLTSATNGIIASFAGAAGAVGRTMTGTDADDILIGAAGADTINGGAGADGLLGNSGADTITGGGGNDVIALTVDSTTDTVVLEATAAGNGIDAVGDFLVGSSNGDVLDATAFLGGAGSFSGVVGAGVITGAGFDATASNIVAIDDTGVITGANLAANIGTGAGDLQLAASSTNLVLLDNAGLTEAYYVTTNAVGEAAATDVVLVGGLLAADTTNLVAANFA